MDHIDQACSSLLHRVIWDEFGLLRVMDLRLAMLHCGIRGTGPTCGNSKGFVMSTKKETNLVPLVIFHTKLNSHNNDDDNNNDL